MNSIRSTSLWASLVFALFAADEARSQAGNPGTDIPPPRVLLLGDSIRLGYEPEAAELLKGRAKILAPKSNGGDSANILAKIDEWIDEFDPEIIHWNCGLHDLKKSKSDGTHQVSLDRYESNLRAIVDKIRRHPRIDLVFASTTPIIDARHAARKATFDRFEADVVRYNDRAISVMTELGIPVHDLHRVVEKEGGERLLGADGTHYTSEGSRRLAAAVADVISRRSAILRDLRNLRPPTAVDAAEYRETEKKRDAAVPERFRDAEIPVFEPARSSEEWRERRRSVLEKVVASLGKQPSRESPPRSRFITSEIHPHFVLEKVEIDNGIDSTIGALLVLPRGRTGPVPAILWLHSSSPDKNQILVPGTNGGDIPLAVEFAKAGFAVFAPDAYWHGERVGTGPSGPLETGVAEQAGLHKYHLWFGRTLWGMFVRDDRVAVDYLVTRPEIDRNRLGATGISMGSTRAWWLAAVDERIKAVVGVACLTRYRDLIRHGELRAHGVYYFVNGLLEHFDIEGVLSLIAPRPYLALTGELDAGSPADGIRTLEGILSRHYEALGARDAFRSVLYPDTGHVYTPEMRKEMLKWFVDWLKP
ncbi:MAG: GDSL-type esterase/lipase family protein [Isosphaeraceae bacterium]|nr:GDSL-type esterase/lipase family protein [Isosphaeraceae bacterium]